MGIWCNALFYAEQRIYELNVDTIDFFYEYRHRQRTKNFRRFLCCKLHLKSKISFYSSICPYPFSLWMKILQVCQQSQRTRSSSAFMRRFVIIFFQLADFLLTCHWVVISSFDWNAHIVILLFSLFQMSSWILSKFRKNIIRSKKPCTAVALHVLETGPVKSD